MKKLFVIVVIATLALISCKPKATPAAADSVDSTKVEVVDTVQVQ